MNIPKKLICYQCRWINPKETILINRGFCEKCQKILISRHAHERMIERGISHTAVERVALGAEIKFKSRGQIKKISGNLFIIQCSDSKVVMTVWRRGTKNWKKEDRK